MFGGFSCVFVWVLYLVTEFNGSMLFVFGKIQR